MRRILPLLLISFLFFSCKKDRCEDCPPDQTFNEALFVSFKLDGVQHSTMLPMNAMDTMPLYNYEWDSAFVAGARFRISGLSYIDVVIGYGQNNPGDREPKLAALRTFAVPERKEYDFLQGDYHPVTNKVEIDFLDTDGIYWTSTKQKYTLDNKFSLREVNQPGSMFEVTHSREYTVIGEQSQTAIITKAKFNCILYENNGERTKTLTEGSINMLYY